MNKTAAISILILFLQAGYTVGQIDPVEKSFEMNAMYESWEEGTYFPSITSGTLQEALDHAFDSLTAGTDRGGYNAAIVLPEGNVWKRAYGFSKVFPTGVKLETDDLMGIGSITKSYVSATVLLLYEDGLLSLDDSIGMYLEPYPNIAGEVTIRQLLSHRSGIKNYSDISELWDGWLDNPDSLWVVDTILNHITAPSFGPNEGWEYSNTNYLLAGKIIESITGQNWYEVVRERILDPLGLENTFCYPFEKPDSQTISQVWFDFDRDNQVENNYAKNITIDGKFSFSNSAGCTLSNPEDVARFHRELYGGTLLQQSSLEEMQTDYNPALNEFYGLGTRSVVDPSVFGIENWGHNGNNLYQSVAFYFPGEEMSLAVQQNDNRISTDYVNIYDIGLALFRTYMKYKTTSSARDMAAIEDLLVYPNPASNTINLVSNLVSSQPYMIQFVGANGHTISYELTGDLSAIDVSSLPAGQYIVLLRDSEYELVGSGRLVKI